MVDENQGGETVQEFLLNSLKSTGFWSFVTAVVGVLALVVGGAVGVSIAGGFCGGQPYRRSCPNGRRQE